MRISRVAVITKNKRFHIKPKVLIHWYWARDYWKRAWDIYWLFWRIER